MKLIIMCDDVYWLFSIILKDRNDSIIMTLINITSSFQIQPQRALQKDIYTQNTAGRRLETRARSVLNPRFITVDSVGFHADTNLYNTIKYT